MCFCQLFSNVETYLHIMRPSSFESGAAASEHSSFTPSVLHSGSKRASIKLSAFPTFYVKNTLRPIWDQTRCSVTSLTAPFIFLCTHGANVFGRANHWQLLEKLCFGTLLIFNIRKREVCWNRNVCIVWIRAPPFSSRLFWRSQLKLLWARRFHLRSDRFVPCICDKVKS